MSEAAVDKSGRKAFTAVLRHDTNGAWLVQLAEEPRVSTYGRTLAKARQHVREATADWFGLGADDFDLIDDVQLPDILSEKINRALAERERAHQARQSAIICARDAARALVDDVRLSMRDAAELLGLSPQRVQQLLSEGGGG